MNPANLFVAGFIGSPAMNFIDAQVQIEQRAVKATFADGKGLLLSKHGYTRARRSWSARGPNSSRPAARTH